MVCRSVGSGHQVRGLLGLERWVRLHAPLVPLRGPGRHHLLHHGLARRPASWIPGLPWLPGLPWPQSLSHLPSRPCRPCPPCPALPALPACPALPCPAQPCPALPFLPCPARPAILASCLGPSCQGRHGTGNREGRAAQACFCMAGLFANFSYSSWQALSLNPCCLGLHRGTASQRGQFSEVQSGKVGPDPGGFEPSEGCVWARIGRQLAHAMSAMAGNVL